MSKLTNEQKAQIAKDSSVTKSQRIIFLHHAGCDRKEIASLMGIITNHVYNVLDKAGLVIKGVAKCDINEKYGHLLKENKKEEGK